MARVTPKTNWVASDIPVATDLNRMENNSEQAFTEIDSEVANRIAAINAETANRTAAINIASQVLSLSAGSNIFYSSSTPIGTTSTSFSTYRTFRIYANGSIRFSFFHVRGGLVDGSSIVRVLKNGSEIQSWTTQSAIQRTIDISVQPGDDIVFQQRTNNASSASTIYDFIASANELLNLNLISNALFYSNFI